MPSRISQGRSIRSSKSSSSSDYSDGSHDSSVSTAPTTGSSCPPPKQYDENGNPYLSGGWVKPQYEYVDFARPSTSESYGSSISSMQDIDHDLPPFEKPDDQQEAFSSRALASSPEEFALYFPSTQRMSIRHDDTTMDGNMNLRVDAAANTLEGGKVDLTLFHLRMHDLKRREFSLRRYCRDSGREVCHSSRKYSKPSAIRRPGLQRSMGSALSSLRSKSDTKTPTLGNLKRHDSGYDSMPEDDIDDEEFDNHSHRHSGSIPIPTNTTLLEFSNYTHLEVKRRGAKSSKKYEVEYWGTKYTWRRVSVRSGTFKEAQYHLVDTKTMTTLAHIVPIPLSNFESREEEVKGGWVPPCSMFFEEQVLEGPTDLADVIVASGLIALVDDCIKSRWHQKNRVQMSVPMFTKSSTKANVEHVGPKRLIDEIFNRREKGSSRRSQSVTEGKELTPIGLWLVLDPSFMIYHDHI